MGRRYTPPDGWTVQAFEFALEAPPAAQATLIARSFGARRYAHNWAVAQIRADLDRFRDTGEQTAAPSLAGLRKRWNQDKHTVAVDTETGTPWRCSISKEVFNDGIGATVDASPGQAASAKIWKCPRYGVGSPRQGPRAACLTASASCVPEATCGAMTRLVGGIVRGVVRRGLRLVSASQPPGPLLAPAAVSPRRGPCVLGDGRGGADTSNTSPRATLSPKAAICCEPTAGGLRPPVRGGPQGASA